MSVTGEYVCEIFVKKTLQACLGWILFLTETVCICTPTPREIHMILYHYHSNCCKIVLRKLHNIHYITSSDDQIFIINDEQNWIPNPNLQAMHGTII